MASSNQIENQKLLANPHAPNSDPRFASSLKSMIEGELPSGLPYDQPSPFTVIKSNINAFIGCPKNWLHQEWPGWSVELARGKVLHKAAEIAMIRSSPTSPLSATKRAFESIIAVQNSLGEYLESLSLNEHHEITNFVNNGMDSIQNDLGFIDKSFRPRAELRIEVSLLDGLFKLVGKPDLTIGTIHGDPCLPIIIDYKTGGQYDSDQSDALFYALLFTLRHGTPPWKVANYYTADGHLAITNIEQATLEHSAKQLAKTICSMVETKADTGGVEAKPHFRCSTCAVLPDCQQGKRHLAQS